MNIRIELTKNPKQKPKDETKLGFGNLFTDHMFLMDYTEGQGWHDARIVPYGPISMTPASSCLHYAQEIFEGMKGYRNIHGDIQLFRPQKNFERFITSCERMVIPAPDQGFLMESLKKFLEIEKDWVPSLEGTSLYIRPFIFANEDFLGVHPSSSYIYCVILSPSGAYYASGINPVDIYVETEYVRATKGGMGMIKTGANYAASLIAQKKAVSMGYAQVLWLDGVERKYVEEVGSMNVFFLIGDEVVTPLQEGTILPGVTRDSVLHLTRHWGLNVSERRLSIDELMEAARSGALKEAWGTGTAAVISPIGKLSYQGEEVIVNNNQIGALSQKLYDTLTGIQWSKIPDEFGWIEPVCKK